MAEPKPLKIQMLGGFSLSTPSARVSDGDNRSKKVWLFLAYMIYRRGQSIGVQDYIDLLWGSEDGGSNPANALKTILHRARMALEPLWPSAGHQLILRQGSSYRWNPLDSIWEMYQQYVSLGRGIYVHRDAIIDYPDLKWVGDPELFGEQWYEYQGKAYSNVLY